MKKFQKRDLKKIEFYEQKCSTSINIEDSSDWIKELIRIDALMAGRVNLPMLCQKVIAKNGKIEKSFRLHQENKENCLLIKN